MRRYVFLILLWPYSLFGKISLHHQVGGLPLPELNHLELQFLLLNDFRLAVPVEELEAYGTMLVEFWMRDHVATRLVPQSGGAAPEDGMAYA